MADRALQGAAEPMISVHFSKDFARQALDAIQNGKPIPLPEGTGWTGRGMLTLAGVLYAAIFSQGPHTHQVAGIDEATRRKWPAEKQEAVEATLRRDIHDGIEFLGMLAFKVADGEYDSDFAPEAAAIIYEKEDGGTAVIPAKGFKAYPDRI
jgi:hypothetical protein